MAERKETGAKQAMRTSARSTTEKPGEMASARRRRRIALLFTRPDIEIDSALLRGITAAAVEADLDLLCFAGGHLNTRQLAQAVFELAAQMDIDGAIISVALGHLVSRDRLRVFCNRYTHVPVVTGQLGLREFPTLTPDTYSGMYDVISHLLEEHDCTRVAFIQGPPGQPEAELRLQAYRNALEAHGIGFDAARVVPGTYLLDSGAAAMRTLWERFGSADGRLALDAIVAANDQMAVGAHQVLSEHGVRVPQEVALVGYDDSESGRALVAPLTTVRQPFDQMGRMAITTLLRMMDGEPITGQVEVPTEVVVRRSCGCTPVAVMRAVSSRRVPAEEAHEMDPDESALWYALLRDLEAEDATAGDAAPAPSEFLTVVEDQLRDLLHEWQDPDELDDRLSSLRRRLVTGGEDVGEVTYFAMSPQRLARVEDLLHQARVLTARFAQQIEAARSSAEEAGLGRLVAFSTTISTVVDVAGLVDPIETFLPGWRIGELYVVSQVGDTPDEGPGGWPKYPPDRRLVLAYQGRAVSIKDESFAAPHLLPDSVVRPSSSPLIAMPLVFRDRLFGYALMSYASPEAMGLPTRAVGSSSLVYGQIAGDLASIFYREELLQEAEQARLQAEASLDEIVRTREIADQVQRAPDAEALLRVALEELSQILGAPRAVARLGSGTGETRLPNNAVAEETGDARRRHGN